MDIKDNLIIVTGAGQGLGREIAIHLAKEGAKLALLDLNLDKIKETADLCMDNGASDTFISECNVAEEESVVSTFEMINSKFGTITGLVNNAGITRDAMLLKAKDGKVTKTMSIEQWQSVINVNLTGTFLCGREAAKHMVESNTKGLIINISSISRAGNMGQTNYSATKAGVEAMAVTWAKELARYGIRANSIAPGFIGTEMVLGMKPEALANVEAMIPAKRLGKPSEIAATVSFLFNNDYTSGRCFEIDGALRL